MTIIKVYDKTRHNTRKYEVKTWTQLGVHREATTINKVQGSVIVRKIRSIDS